MYLTGTFKHNLDAKQRITLPAPFRKEFNEKVVLIPVSGKIYGFTPEGHREWVESFFAEGFDPRNKNHVKLRRALTSMAFTVELDSAGRIALGKLGAETIGKCGIEREVTVLGNVDHFEIWDSARYEQEMSEVSDDLEDLMFG